MHETTPRDRLARLRALHEAACLRAPALQALYGRAGMTPADVRSAADLARLAVTPKDKLVDMQRAAPPFGGWLAADPSEIRRVFVSPGPIHEPQLHGDVDGHGFARVFSDGAVGPGDMVLNTWSYHLVPAGLLLDDAIAACGATVIPAGTGGAEAQAQMVIDLGVSCICASTAYFENLVHVLESKGHVLPAAWRVRTALLGGELGDWLGKRRRLEARLGIRTLSAYATADFGLIGFEEPGHEGYTIHPDRLVQIFDPVNGQPLPLGMPGEIVVTTLARGWPLVRFGTGDVAAASAISEDGFVARIGMLQGRVGQAVKVREIFVYPRQIEDLVLQSSALHRAQGVVSRQGHRDVIDLHVMFGSAGTPELEADLRDRFKQLTRLRFDSLVLLGADAALPDDAPWLVDRRHG